MKFCKDCKHYSPMKFKADDGDCSAPQHGINLVTGVQNIKVCSYERSYDATKYKDHCGKQAIFFEGV